MQSYMNEYTRARDAKRGLFRRLRVQWPKPERTKLAIWRNLDTGGYTYTTTRLGFEVHSKIKQYRLVKEF